MADPDPSLEPLAIVGFSLNFPQEMKSAEDFWSLLVQRRNVSSDFPEKRMNIDSFYHPDKNRKDTVSGSVDACV